VKKKHNRDKINSATIQLPYVQEEGKTMGQEEEKKSETIWWIVLIALLVLVVVGGAYLRWNFWTG